VRPSNRTVAIPGSRLVEGPIGTGGSHCWPGYHEANRNQPLAISFSSSACLDAEIVFGALSDPIANEKATVMQINNFKDMYIAELQELVSVEGQLAGALTRMAAAASNPALKEALMLHQEETLVQRKQLESILQKHDASAAAHVDQSMQALVHETKKMLTMLKGDELRDAGLIASVQKLEHYEIAAYGSAAALAGQLDLREDQKILHECLEEERETDALLTKLAKSEVNQHALAA
jgi:ferritin-like metal-binding protein YciE